MALKLSLQLIDSAYSTLKKEKIFTLKRLISLLGCSRRTAQTVLSRWKTFTSYNHNSRYYTLPEIPKFNQHGLWWYENVAFSKNGNLKKTVVHLIYSSASGLTGKEISDILGLLAKNIVHHFKNYPDTIRRNHGGIYVYFADKTSVFEKQQQLRRSSIHERSLVSISNSEAVLILIALIKHHDISIQKITALPEIKKNNIKFADIQGFLEYHGLVKKTSVFRL